MTYMNASATLDRPPGSTPDEPADVGVVVAALADGTRRRLLRLVRSDELSAGSLAAEFPTISRPAVSQHLRVLHDAGLVDVRAVGNRRLYRARAEALAPVSQFIDDMWGDRLQRLKTVAEARDRGVS